MCMAYCMAYRTRVTSTNIDDEDVLGCEIPVHDLVGVQRVDGGCQSTEQVQGDVDGDCFTLIPG